MTGKVRFVSLQEPEVFYETGSETFCIGRSPDCEIHINDPHISRRQAEARLTEHGLEITNLGRNPLRIHGQPSMSAVLVNQDVVGLGAGEYVVLLAAAADQVLDQKTVVLGGQAAVTDPGPRFVGTDPQGKEISFVLDADSVSVGRAEEADLRLDDPAVSRRHFMIERLNKGFFVQVVGGTNPLQINEEQVSRAKLHHGDTLTVGQSSLTFLSDRPQDARPHPQPEPGGLHIPYWKHGLAAVGVIVVAMVVYLGLIAPMRESSRIESAVALLEQGQAEQAYDSLTQSIGQGLSKENEASARSYLSQAALRVAEDAALDNPGVAELFLVEYLREHGADLAAEPVWDALDEVRLIQGERLEAQGDYRAAIAKYAAVREDGPLYDEAQGLIGRAWRTSREAEMDRLQQRWDVEKLLTEARAHFQAKRFLTPPDNNAYNAYKAVLSIDPDNEQAFLGIRQIKAFYQEHAERHYKAGNCDKAVSYYRRLLLIEPGDEEALQRVAECRSKVTKPDPRPKSKKPSQEVEPAAQDKRREEVRKLLDKSGTDSSKVLKYLFGEQGEGQEKDMPW